MKPENHQIEEENHLPNLHSWVPAVNYQGCTLNYSNNILDMLGISSCTNMELWPRKNVTERHFAQQGNFLGKPPTM